MLGVQSLGGGVVASALLTTSEFAWLFVCLRHRLKASLFWVLDYHTWIFVFWTCSLKGPLSYESSYFFLPGYPEVQSLAIGFQARPFQLSGCQRSGFSPGLVPWGLFIPNQPRTTYIMVLEFKV